MVDQVDFEVAGLLLIPGDAFHGDVLGDLAGVLRTFAGETRLVSRDAGQDALGSGDTHLVQLLQQGWGDFQFTMSGQVIGHPNQIGGEALGAEVVQALGDDAQGILDLWTIGAPPLPLPRLALQASVHEAGQALTMQFGHRFHLVQELTFLLASGGLDIALFHPAQILASFVNVHFVFVGHFSLR
jgi:hypothetical protein